MCSENDHDFKRQGSPYFKLFADGRLSGLGTLPAYNQTKSYQMLYCPKCGETKEIVASNHTVTA